MMFGAGIGMLTFATAEPMYHFATNPNVIMGESAYPASLDISLILLRLLQPFWAWPRRMALVEQFVSGLNRIGFGEWLKRLAP